MHRSKHFLILGSVMLAASLLFALTPIASTAFAATIGTHSASRASTITHSAPSRLAVNNACSSSCAINPCPPSQAENDPNNNTSWVEVIQFRLNFLESAGLMIDGIFGPSTKNAVITFQNAVDITDGGGAVGDRTWSAMGFCTGFSTIINGFFPVSGNPNCPPGLSDGSSGIFVQALQALLNIDHQVGALPNSPDNFHPYLAFDGIFGSNTKAAVTDFQDADNITRGGGAVGQRTWSGLGMRFPS